MTLKTISSTPVRLATPLRESTLLEPTPAPPRETPKVKDGFESPTSQAVGPRDVKALLSPSILKKLEGDKAKNLLGLGLHFPNIPVAPLATPPQVPPGALNALSAAEQAKMKEAIDGQLGGSAQLNLDKVVKSEGFKALNAQQQAQVLRSYLAGPPTSSASSRSLTALVDSAGFRGLDATQKTRALEVFNATDITGRENLVTLTHRQVNGQSALLDKDKTGTTLLENLHAIAREPLASEFATQGISRASLLSSVMEEAGQPGQVNQSDHGTCTVTSMQYMLTSANPAEYVRILRGLTSPAGGVQLRGGAQINRDAGSVAPDSATDRSATERIFQSAMMEYANGSHDYNNTTDRNTGNDKILGIFNNYKNYSGLYSDQEERAIEALFGRDFFPFKGLNPFRNDGQEIREQLQARNHQQTLVDLKWGNGGHAVVVEKIENGRVYFRNPWGPTSDPQGTTYNDPSRRLEDGATRLESMSVEDFERCARCAYLPR